MKNSYGSWYESYKPYFEEWLRHIHKMIKKLFKIFDDNVEIRYMIFYSIVIFITLYSLFMILSLFNNVPILILISVILSYIIVQTY